MNKENGRKNIRFNADQNALVWISKDAENFTEDIVGLVDSESYMGLSMIILRDRGILENDELFVKVDNFEPTWAIVRWVKKMDDSLFKFGLEYISQENT